MAFVFRLGKSKLGEVSRHCRSFPRRSLLHPIVSHGKPCLARNPNQSVHNHHADFCNGLRFFAVPIRFQKPSKEEEKLTGFRMNEEITAEFVRVVIDREHSVVPTRAALLRAKQLNLDLVEVQPKANPPVCRLMDYNKEKFEKELKEKERVKTKAVTSLRRTSPKEIRFSGKTDQKDLQIKASNIRRLMEDGYIVKCTATGTVETDVMGSLTRLCALIGDIAIVESGPTLGKTSAYLLVRHVKFGKKKGGTKKLKDLTDENSGILVAKNPAPPTAESNSEIGEEILSVAASSTSNKDIYGSIPEAPSEVESANMYSRKGGSKNQFSPTVETYYNNIGLTNYRDPRESRELPTNEPMVRDPGTFSRNAPRSPRPGYGQSDGPMAGNLATARQGGEERQNENNVQNRYATKNRRANQTPGDRSRQRGFGTSDR